MGERIIKIGIFGCGRGASFAGASNQHIGVEVVALCDKNVEKMNKLNERLNVATYTDFDAFIKHDGMDAVVLTNYFHEHAPYAIKSLHAGKHVLSECVCNATLKEGVELCEAVEETGLIYMLAENYPYTKFNQEFRNLYQKGEIGEILYAEGEYNHSATNAPHAGYPLYDGPDHWRFWNTPTSYCTHAIAPLVYVTGQMPVQVNTQVARLTSNTGMRDNGFIMVMKTTNGSIFRTMGGFPGHSNHYRFHGTKGAMEMTRGPGYFGPEQVRVWHEDLNVPDGLPLERTYVPNWPEYAELASRAGHGGGDFWLNYHFATAIRTNTQPFLNVYQGVGISSVGIFGWMSALENGKTFRIPDFSDKAEREQYRHDNYSPYPTKEDSTWIRNTIRPDATVEMAREAVLERWEQLKVRYGIKD
ncbi:MAG: Gfo/Idh/MocA family oxidoreductase [Clostridiales bacterium]|nr:Gfo/Idh/MocA family oxidoreductase [Clostridiales bacterium]